VEHKKMRKLLILIAVTIEVHPAFAQKALKILKADDQID